MREGKGPARLASERSTEVTEEKAPPQETPVQWHGESSRGFQLESEEFGSSRESLTC